MYNGPVLSIWHIDGHGYPWQKAQMDAGLPLEFSIRMTHSVRRNNPTHVNILNVSEPILSTLNGKTISLRMNNIRGGEVDDTIGRVSPLTADNWRTEHMCVLLKADGTYDSIPTPSPFAGEVGIIAWTKAGKEWAISLWMKRLQQIIHSPQKWILRENNEAGRVSFGQLWEQTKAQVKNHNNVYVWAEKATPIEYWVHPDTKLPFTSDWKRLDPNSTIMWRWKPDNILDAAVDLRAKEWVGPRRHLFPTTAINEFYELENAQYHALYNAFESNSAAGWQGTKEGFVGYGGWDENQQNESASSTLYLAFYRSKILTDKVKAAGTVGNYYDWVIDYRDQCNANNAKWNELSISINKAAIHAGPVAGKHAAIDPKSYADYMTWVAWILQGKDVRLVEWHGYQTKPEQRLYADTDAALLSSINRSDLLGVTIGDYELATLASFNKIHDNAILTKYWKEGTTTVKIFATETTLPNITTKLVYVYSPCDLTEEINVGNYTLPGAFNRSGYYLVDQSGIITLDIGIDPRPLADFTFSLQEYEVQFTNSSISVFGSLSYQWDFGDGTTSTEKDPVHTYAPGNYVVTLKVTNEFGFYEMSYGIEIVSAETPEEKITRLTQEIIMLQQKIDEVLALNTQQAQKITELGVEANVLEQQVVGLEADKTTLTDKISAALALINQAKTILE
jgi:PKD repeat protein